MEVLVDCPSLRLERLLDVRYRRCPGVTKVDLVVAFPQAPWNGIEGYESSGEGVDARIVPGEGELLCREM